jgi:formate dehydrogenase subunit gamma
LTHSDEVAQSPAPFDPDKVVEIIAAHASLEGPLLPILHAVQTAFGCVPGDAVPIIAGALNLTRAEVHGVASFYHDFRDEPSEGHVIKLCRAEACQARGCEPTIARVEDRLGVKLGETRADDGVRLEAVYCLGLCASGPAALVDGRPVARLSGARLERLLTDIAS